MDREVDNRITLPHVVADGDIHRTVRYRIGIVNDVRDVPAYSIHRAQPPVNGME
ncbi:MAG: hypothetical protein R2825_22575 [Saprospiraceae bacterium]